MTLEQSLAAGSAVFLVSLLMQFGFGGAWFIGCVLGAIVTVSGVEPY